VTSDTRDFFGVSVARDENARVRNEHAFVKQAQRAGQPPMLSEAMQGVHRRATSDAI
jgi:hypothetical protein